MALTSFDNYLAANRQTYSYYKSGTITTVANQWSSLWTCAGQPGAGTASAGNTANGTICIDTRAGSGPIGAFSGSNSGYISRICWQYSVLGQIALYDRIFACGQYAENSGTTNLASQPAISSRVPSTNYNGLQIWVEVTVAWTAATASSVTVTYTDQDGNTGASTGAYTLPTAVIANRTFKLPLAAGDSGVQKIESVTLTDVTGSPSAGSINVLILRPLWKCRCFLANYAGIDGFEKTGLPQIYANSCLFAMVQPDSTSSGVPDLLIDIIDI